MSELLKNCKSPTHSGPCGKTALHVAPIPIPTLKSFTTSSDTSSNIPSTGYSCLRLLLEHNYGHLIKAVDEYGWTPLHYAARGGHLESVKLLLTTDKSAAYVASSEPESITALHLAVAAGRTDVMDELLLHCPDCWQITNAKGRNILHIAIEMEQDYEVIKNIMDRPIARLLINQKDKDGNTPLHLLAACAFALNDPRNQLWKLGDTSAFNNSKLTPIDIEARIHQGGPFTIYWWEVYEGNVNSAIRYHGWRNIAKDDHDNIKKTRRKLGEEVRRNEEECRRMDRERKEAKKCRRKEKEEGMSKMEHTHVIVATLITTVAFAAGFAIPGGYNGSTDPKQDSAVLLKKAAFKVFVITNSIALVASLASVILYISISLNHAANDDKIERELEHRYSVAFFLVVIAIGALIVAFVTGSYAVFARSKGLAIFIILLGCSTFYIYFLELKKNGVGQLLFIQVKQIFVRCPERHLRPSFGGSTSGKIMGPLIDLTKVFIGGVLGFFRNWHIPHIPRERSPLPVTS